MSAMRIVKEGQLMKWVNYMYGWKVRVDIVQSLDKL